YQFPPEWQKKAEEAYSEYAGPGHGREEYPAKVRFVTHTLMFPSCAWVEIIGMGRHYEPAHVEADRAEAAFLVKTKNVRALRLRLADSDLAPKISVRIDGQEVSAKPVRTGPSTMNVFVEKQGDKWNEVLPQKLVVDRLRRPQKSAGLQGPIDAAFTGPF